MNLLPTEGGDVLYSSTPQSSSNPVSLHDSTHHILKDTPVLFKDLMNSIYEP